MNIAQYVTIAVSCLLLQQNPISCVQERSQMSGHILGTSSSPVFRGQSIDVVLTAQAALAWDVETDTILYSRNADEQRPIASISKLLSAITVRTYLPLDTVVTIPPQVKRMQLLGAHIKLPVGEHADAGKLLSASLIASANDAMVALAVATSGSEKQFIERANALAHELNVHDTKLANATGLSGKEQYSTARDVKNLIMLAYKDPVLLPLLDKQRGTLTTQEGTKRTYTSTNDLLGTYLPIIAAKTGYTDAAGESLVIITEQNSSKRIGIVILGSTQRFQDAKVLAEWIWRNFKWNQT